MKISIVQNFICTLDTRLKILQDNISKYSEVFTDCNFVVNFNDTVNFDIINHLYSTELDINGDVFLFNNLIRDWALTTLSMMEYVNTPYVLYLCEDQVPNMTKLDFDNIINEFSDDLDMDYMLLTRIGKYTEDIYTKNYTEHKYGYSYLCENAPHKRLSLDAIYRTDFFKERLEEFILNHDKCTHDIPFRQINLPNFYEGYYDFYNGTARFSGVKCYIPKQNILVEYNDEREKYTYI